MDEPRFNWSDDSLCRIGGCVFRSEVDGPQGVTLDSANPVIKHGDTEAKVTLKARDDAALGDFTIKVTGHPSKGADATNHLRITVAKK